MHRGFVGDRRHRKGNGKTVAAVREVVKLYLKGHHRIYSNIWLAVPHILISATDLIKLGKDPESLRHSIIFIDEIQNVFNSIGKGTANLVFNFIQNQTRKGDTHLYWTSQRAANVDNRIVDDAMLFHCSKWHFDGQRCLDSEDVCHKEHFIKVINIFSKAGYAFRLNDYVVDLYDTSEVVPLAFFQHEKIRAEIREDHGRPGKAGPAIETNAMGNGPEVLFVGELQRILGKRAIIRHNARYNDGNISLYDVEVEHEGKLHLFDVVGSVHSDKGNMRLITDHKDWGDMIAMADSRHALPWLAFKNGTGWKALEISRGAEWIRLKGKITMTQKRMGAACDVSGIF